MHDFMRTPHVEFQADKPHLHFYALAEPLLAVTCVAATSFEWRGDELQAVRKQHDVCHPGHWHWHWHWRRLGATYLTATMIVAVAVAALYRSGFSSFRAVGQRP